MQEHTSNPGRTIIILVVFAVILIIGAAAMSKPSLTYSADIHQSLENLNQEDGFFYPWQLNDFAGQKSQDIVLFDIRNAYAFAQGHIPGAENIPAIDLTHKDFMKRMEKLRQDKVTVVLYGDDQLQANGPWMVFRQTGFDNVRVLTGGYTYYMQHQNDLAATRTDDSFRKGLPRYDFAKMAAPKDGAAIKAGSEKKPVEIKRRKKTTAVAGGC